MKKILLTVALLVTLMGRSEVKKAPIFIDKFIPNGECRITPDGIQILHDRIVGNVVSSRKYEVV